MVVGTAADSGPSSIVTEAKAQIKLLQLKQLCQQLIKLKLQSAKAPNRPWAVVEDLLQVMHGNLKELASYNAAKLE